MSGQHKYAPLRFRPPEAERLWLAAYAEQTGKAVNAILTEAVRRLRLEVEAAQRTEDSHD